jgi:hypothetical protein
MDYRRGRSRATAPHASAGELQSFNVVSLLIVFASAACGLDLAALPRAELLHEGMHREYNKRAERSVEGAEPGGGSAPATG